MVPVSSVRWNLLARGLEDVEFFVALDKLLTNKLAGGEACYSTSAHGDDHALACCSLATEASSALDAVGDVVWDFPDSKNLSSAPYSSDTGLLHRVLDGVAVAINRVESSLGNGLVC